MASHGPVSEAAQDTGSFFGMLLLSPFHAVIGLVEGVLGSLGTGVIATAALTALGALAPQFATCLAGWIGGKDMAEKLASSLSKEGVVGALKVAAPLGFGAAGLFGGGKSMIERATGQEHGEGGLGSIVGATVVMAVVGSVALGAFTNKEIKPEGNADPAAPKQPDATPGQKPAPAKHGAK